MASEICPICKQDCTPWRVIGLIGTVCNDCSADEFQIQDKPIGDYLKCLIKDKAKLLEFVKIISSLTCEQINDGQSTHVLPPLAKQLLKELGELPYERK